MSLARQMILILTVSLTLLLATFIALETLAQENVIETAQNPEKLHKLKALKPLIELMSNLQAEEFINYFSRCHEGYTLTDKPFDFDSTSLETNHLVAFIQKGLSLNNGQVKAGYKNLTRENFSYSKCETDMDFPIDGLVIGIRLSSGKWFNAEVHAHQWHLRDIHSWVLWSVIAFLIIAGSAIFFISHLTRPLSHLSNAARQFADGLKVARVKETGPQDIRRTIQSFNAMQQQVANEIVTRTATLAAISHDIRTPLTALRIKAELIEDGHARESLIASINKMEKIIASGLDFLKGENRTEPMRKTDLTALLESECLDFSELGEKVLFVGHEKVLHACRPVALARAIRNLIENAVKYGGSATVELHSSTDFVSIHVSDHGCGIPDHLITSVVEPFKRISDAREGDKGGFGLGLSIVKAIAEGHGGDLILQKNKPSGLIATIRLPK